MAGVNKGPVQPSKCLGHKEREDRKVILGRGRSTETPDDNRVLIKIGSTTKETSLKDLEENYKTQPEWQVIEDGGVLSVPVAEFRIENPPKPDPSGKVMFRQKPIQGGGKKIDDFPVTETIEKLDEALLAKHNKEKASGTLGKKSESTVLAKTLNAWGDINAEIKLKKALENMMEGRKIPAFLIRSTDLRHLTALKDLGLQIPEDGEIDLMLAFVSGDFLHVVLYEVKRSDSWPWVTKSSRPPNQQAVRKAESQLTKDVKVLMAILAGVPQNQVKIHTLACFPETPLNELQNIVCTDCHEKELIYEEDLNDLSSLQRKSKVPDKPDSATDSGKQHLLTLTARCLSKHSLLHNGYRKMEDLGHLINERHKYNLEHVDGKVMLKEFVVASLQQRQAIASFLASLIHRHLLLTGFAGTGKTLVALQVANVLIQSLEATAEPGKGPVLVVAADRNGFLPKDSLLSKHLDANTTAAKTKVFDDWEGIKKEYGVSESERELQLLHLTEALAKRWEGRQIVILLDEIYFPEDTLNSPIDQDEKIPDCVRLILIVNPRNSSDLPTTLPESFLRIDLSTPYRSTIAITSLARFIAKCEGKDVPEGDFGSDVDGKKPIVFDIGKDEVKLREALQRSRDRIGDDATLLYDYRRPSSMKEICESTGKEKGGPWECSDALNFFGWEADTVVAVTIGGLFTLEMMTRARTQLIIILVESDNDRLKKYYKDDQKHFQDAAAKGLVELVSI